MTYTPKPGGGPAKLADYLGSKEPGYRVSNATASAIMCLPVASITNTLRPAVDAGFFLREEIDGKPLYSLPDALATGAELGRVEQPEAEAAPTLLSLRGIAAGCRVEQPAEVPDLDEALAGATEPEPFHACLHLDGDLDLHGLIPLAHGGYRIEAADVGRLLRLLVVR